MAFEDEQRGSAQHRLTLEGREELSVTGVEDVESFDEESIVMHTAGGTLVVRGEGLHIETLSLDGGELRVEGLVESLTYEEGETGRPGFFARLMGA